MSRISLRIKSLSSVCDDSKTNSISPMVKKSKSFKSFCPARVSNNPFKRDIEEMEVGEEFPVGGLCHEDVPVVDTLLGHSYLQRIVSGLDLGNRCSLIQTSESSLLDSMAKDALEYAKERNRLWKSRGGGHNK